MLPLCLFCCRALPANDVVGHFPLGRRVAFDPVRGRLWAVCPGCARWNLAPIEERWEALEELERLCRDQGRLLTQTENIGLLRAGELDIVRVGRAQLREEAWWRYGRELARRRSRSQQLLVLDVALALTVGFPLIRSLWRGRAFAQGAPARVRRCSRCGASLTEGAMAISRATSLVLQPGDGSGPGLFLPCRYCASRGQEGGAVWTGAEALRLLRPTMAYQNFDGGKPAQVDAACELVLRAGSPAEFIRELAERRLQLAAIGVRVQSSLALEIALNEDDERRVLQLEAAALEARWREAEELAAIVDRELTPLPQTRRERP